MFSGQNPPACSVLRMKNTVWTQCWVGDGAKGTVQWLIRGARKPTLTTALLPYLPTLPCSTLSTTCVLYPCISPHSTQFTTLPYHHPPLAIFFSPELPNSSNQWRLLSTALYSSLCISTIDFLQFICPVSYTKRCMLYLQGVPFILGEAFSWQGAG